MTTKFIFTTPSKYERNYSKSFSRSLKTFKGLEHRYEIFLKKKNYVFINDSKATSFQATKFALRNTKDIFWIVGGLPKKNDILNLSNLSKNIVKCYIIGKNIDFYKRHNFSFKEIEFDNEIGLKLITSSWDSSVLKNYIIYLVRELKKLDIRSSRYRDPSFPFPDYPPVRYRSERIWTSTVLSQKKEISKISYHN